MNYKMNNKDKLELTNALEKLSYSIGKLQYCLDNNAIDHFSAFKITTTANLLADIINHRYKMGVIHNKVTTMTITIN